MERLRRRTSSTDSPASSDDPPPSDSPNTDSTAADTSPFDDPPNPDPETPESATPTDEDGDSDWLDDDFVQQAVDDAAEDLEDDSLQTDPLFEPTGDDRTGDAADTGETRLADRPDETEHRTDDDRSDESRETDRTDTVEAQYETDYQIEPDVDLEAPAPVALADAGRVQRAVMPDLEPPPGTTYRLKIGHRVYGELDFEQLVSLFRCGVWMVADEIAEADGEFCPVDSHPVYRRIRHLIADGVTDLVATRGRLLETVDDTSDHDDPGDPGDADDSAETDADPPTSNEADSSESDPESRPPPVPEDPPEQPTEQASQQPADSPTPPAPRTDSSSPADLVRAARATLPWTIAVIMTGLFGAALTYGLVAGPAAPDADPTAQPTAAGPADDSDDDPDTAAPSVDDATDLAAQTATDAADLQADDLAESALERGHYRRTRDIAARAHALSPDQSPRLQSLFDRAVIQDPELMHQIRTMVPDVDADGLAPIAEGASVTLRFTRDGDNRYAFKADRKDWEDGWRVEVAAYQLCNLLDCDFDFPVHEPARIAEDDFHELYDRRDDPTQRRYADRRFDELIWHDEQGPDGQTRAYLYGVLKEWIPRYTRWPIEHVQTWSPWLDVDHDEAILDEDFDDYLERLGEVYDGRFIDGLRRETDGYETRHLARQLSNLHVFDYLTTNYDRYSEVDDYLGVNAHFADGRFVPIDNSAAFQRVDLRVPRMDRRIRNVSRFSRRLIDTIRMLRPEVVEPILFPEPSDRERRRLDIFWDQRDKLLDYVDELVDEHGQEAVYAFD